jgi:hypothetical protein
VRLVSYDAARRAVTVETFQASTWTTHARVPASMQPGDRFGVRALTDGSVTVLVNGVEIGTTVVHPFFAGRGGHVGAWFESAARAVFDDFRGGTVP